MSQLTITLGVPQGGLNNTDMAQAIGDNQAQSLRNLQTSTGVFESMRGTAPIASSIPFNPLAGQYTDDVIVFRTPLGLIRWVFAHGGKVYSAASPAAPATEIVDPVTGTGFGGDPARRIRLIQFANHLYIMNGSDPNKAWDGTNLWNMGISPPVAAPSVTEITASTNQRDYYYTYTNSTWGTESNPSPVTHFMVHDPVNDPSVGLQMTTEEGVDGINIYRTDTAGGIGSPRLCGSATNANQDWTDASLNQNVASDVLLRFDHDKPPPLKDAFVFGTRVMAWEDGGSTLYISSDSWAEYMPVLDWFDGIGGGTLPITPGDGQPITAMAAWGGMAVIFKSLRAFRLIQTQVGFYDAQPMNISGCIAPHSPQLIPDGLIWLSNRGWRWLNFLEVEADAGLGVKSVSNNLTGPALVSSLLTSSGVYLVSFLLTGAMGYQGMMWSSGGGWSGVHDTGCTCLWEDIDGAVYGGQQQAAGIVRFFVEKLGPQPLPDPQVSPVPIQWIDKARSFGSPESLVQLDRVTVACWQIGGNAPQSLNLVVRDKNAVVLATVPFAVPSAGGQVSVGLPDVCYGEALAVGIEGTVTGPIQISWVSIDGSIAAPLGI